MKRMSMDVDAAEADRRRSEDMTCVLSLSRRAYG
jgi:hypothetical protein